MMADTTTTKTRPYRAPVLAWIYRAVGVLAMLPGVALMAMGAIAAAGAPVPVVVGMLVGGAVMVIGGAILWGLGEVVDLLGRTAYHSARSAVALEYLASRARSMPVV